MKKIRRQKFFSYLNAYYFKAHLIEALTLLILPEHIEDYKKIEKQDALGNYFCLKMISKLSPQ